MNTEEIEFLAEQEEVTIIPKFTDSRVVHLISGDIGPFRAGIPCVVPIWVAKTLRKKHKCKIVAPEWMELDLLEQKLEEEKSSRFFTPMPSDHYMGIAHLLLSDDSDIEHADRLRLTIKNIWDVRVAKARASADTFLKGGGRHAGIDHLTQLEICNLRPLLLDALDTKHQLSVPMENMSALNTSAASGSLSESFSSASTPRRSQ
ncbi:DNA replication complex GINS protein PSF2 [Nesidiocoris tenuis]|uniref:DNA replication complex GINS protein PSF2 n=1 Tax=Nesidiocoris tenuis TaxID=355587 RepID=A0ABN7B5L3_9HEMI|nr:DNA replication complex GINS protein PSF2 [Nesidiocoris tenuis]